MRVAVLGAGEMGRMHARAYASLKKREDVEVAGVFSRRASKARKLAREVGGVACTKVRRFLEDETVDAVDITVPSAFHRPLAVAALERGKHVLCETPMALNVQDADAMTSAARKHRRILMVAQVMRFVAPYAAFRDRVVSGGIGRPRFAEAIRLSRPYWTRNPPRPFSAYGDPVSELMIHDFDFLNWTLGKPKSVFASGVVGTSGSVEHAYACVDYGKVKALVEGGGMMPPGYSFSTSVRVRGDRALLDLSQRFTGGEGPETTFLEYRTRSGPKAIHVRGVDPYLEECRHFVRSIQGEGDPSRLSPVAEREAIRVAVAALDSIRQQEPVRLTA